MTSVTLNGHTYTDDANPTTGMAGGGHRQRFIPALADFVVDAGVTAANKTAAANSAAAAAASAASAVSAPGTSATSTTSLTVGTGSKTLTIQTGKSIVVGMSVKIASTATPTIWMNGDVTSYNSGTGALTVNVGHTLGAGTFADWTISLSAPPLTNLKTVVGQSLFGSGDVVVRQLTFNDTRLVNPPPYTYTGASVHLKTNTTDSLQDGGEYHTVFDCTSCIDSSGGPAHQLGFTSNGNVWHRASTADSWGPWRELLSSANTKTLNGVPLVGAGDVVIIEGDSRAVVAVAALDINCSLGVYFTKTISTSSTFTFSNVPSGVVYAFTLELTHTSGTVTWPSSVKWPYDAAPTLTTGKTHLFTFVTDDGGTRWRGVAVTNYTN